MRLLGIVASRRLQLKYSVFLPYNCDFDGSLILRHPSSIIIGDGVRLGSNVIIFQNVTIGRSDTDVANYPKIGDNVIIYAGAVIVGDVEIGANCIIGANSVVTKSIPDNSIAVGAPAKIISRS
ncbi:serine acetyltransferase [Comamonas aquatica]|nr:serine acetyltransferase [Comamonas aquatica]